MSSEVIVRLGANPKLSKFLSKLPPKTLLLASSSAKASRQPGQPPKKKVGLAALRMTEEEKPAGSEATASLTRAEDVRASITPAQAGLRFHIFWVFRGAGEVKFTS